MARFIRGECPRPRVAILGKFPDESVQAFERMFPTLYKANTLPQLEELVDVRELDVTVRPNCPQTKEQFPCRQLWWMLKSSLNPMAWLSGPSIYSE